MVPVGRMMHQSYFMNPGPLQSPLIPDPSDIPTTAFAAEPALDSAFTKRLASPVLKYLGGRGVLLGIETREAFQQGVTVIVCSAVAAMAALAGWLLVAASLAGFLSSYFEWSWIKATAIVGAAHLLIALTAALKTWHHLSAARWFENSLNEFKKDRVWLKTQTAKN
jgi:hypothetical protein